MNQKVNIIIKMIQNLPKPTIVGISGFGGSGKSMLASIVGEKLSVPIIDVDSFIKSNVHKGYTLWEIIDFQRLEREVLKPYIQGNQSITYGHFDWGTNKIDKDISFFHNGIIIIEGVGLFRPELMKYFGYSIWIDCPIEEAIKRGKKRDREVYRNPQDKYWDRIWKKNDIQYFKKFSPDTSADYVIDYLKH